jgi:hypothetical protein
LFGILKMKALFFGLLLVSPPVAAWILHAPEPALQTQEIQALPTPRTVPQSGAIQMPVEIVTKGGAPEWVYVEVSQQSIPEPGVVSLAAMASLLLLRRQRSAGK